jgi:hypothetical protein
MSLTASQSYQISSFIVICITELCWIIHIQNFQKNKEN